MNTRILLVDDHKLVREGLNTLIEKHTDMTVVGEADNGRTAVKLARKLTPDIIIMDIAMPELNGIEATRKILDESKNTRVIILSMHSDKRYVAKVLRTGASAYLLKDSAFEELAEAIRVVLDNRIYLSPRITDIVIEDYVHSESVVPSAYTELTDREREVLQLIAEGKTTKDISSTLYVSVKTVEAHRKKIMDKLDIHSIADLTKYAIREGMISLD